MNRNLVVALLVHVLARTCTAQFTVADAPEGDVGDSGLTSVVVYIIIVAFAVTCLVFAILGEFLVVATIPCKHVSLKVDVVAGFIIAKQYPQPHCLCYNKPFSDMSRHRNCCSLYRVNTGFAAIWGGG